jgi:hypothetical protein
MLSPFPGMDPFLEHQVWADFHSDFIVALRAELMPRLRPRYVARVEERVYVIQEPEETVGSIRPDVSVWESGSHEPGSGGFDASITATLVEPVTIPLAMPERVLETFLEIRLLDSRELVTVIELLSPTNKRSSSDGRREYLTKRDAVLSSSANLIELDLLREGRRLPMGKRLPPAPFYVIESRAAKRPLADVWPIPLRQPLPNIPVPLAGTDPDVRVDLQSLFASVYERAGYDYSVDYTRAASLRLSSLDEEWVRTRLQTRASQQA